MGTFTQPRDFGPGGSSSGYINDLLTMGAVDPLKNTNLKTKVDDHTSQLAEKVTYVDNVALLKLNTKLKVNDLVMTRGYYEKNDFGEALYEIVNDPSLIEDGGRVHNVANGLKAKMIITNKVNVHQFGAKGDWNGTTGTNDISAINKAIAVGVDVYCCIGKKYLIQSPIAISTKITLFGEGSEIIAKDCDGILITSYYTGSATLNNLTITKNGTKTNIGINSDSGGWGTGCVLNKVTVNGFKIGVQLAGNFKTRPHNVVVLDCSIGFYIKDSNGVFGNVIDLSSCLVMRATYGVVFKSVINSKLDSCTIEDCPYAVIINGGSFNISFNNQWFELISTSVVEFADVNVGDLSLTKMSETASHYFNFNSIKFSRTRFSKDGLNSTFYPADRKFLSTYGYAGDNNGFEDNIEHLLSSGIEYKNIVSSSFFGAGLGSGTSAQPVISTPFGAKQCVRVTGATGSSARVMSSIVTTNIVLNNVYLMKAKIKTKLANSLMMNLTNQIGADITTGSPANTVFSSVDDEWSEISSIVQSGVNGADGTEVWFNLFFNTNNLTNVNLDVIDLFCINLSSIFGVGKEPPSYLTKKISKHFTYTEYSQVAKTGNGFVLHEGGTTTNRPPNPTLYQNYFDATLNKPIWWNGTVWKDSTGTTV